MENAKIVVGKIGRKFKTFIVGDVAGMQNPRVLAVHGQPRHGTSKDEAIKAAFLVFPTPDALATYAKDKSGTYFHAYKREQMGIEDVVFRDVATPIQLPKRAYASPEVSTRVVNGLENFVRSTGVTARDISMGANDNKPKNGHTADSLGDLILLRRVALREISEIDKKIEALGGTDTVSAIRLGMDRRLTDIMQH